MNFDSNVSINVTGDLIVTGKDGYVLSPNITLKDIEDLFRRVEQMETDFYLLGGNKENKDG